MIFRTRAPLAMAAAALLALSACESATESTLSPTGSLAFTYAGADSGSYSASGRFDRRRPSAGTFAVGSRFQIQSGEEALLVLAHVPRGGRIAIADEFLLSLESPAVGEVSCETVDADCPIGAIFFIGSTGTGATEAIYSSVSGTINITQINEDRAQGTFSFEMVGVSEGDAPAPTTQVTSGTFDVPLVPGVA